MSSLLVFDECSKTNITVMFSQRFSFNSLFLLLFCCCCLHLLLVGLENKFAMIQSVDGLCACETQSAIEKQKNGLNQFLISTSLLEMLLMFAAIETEVIFKQFSCASMHIISQVPLPIKDSIFFFHIYTFALSTWCYLTWIDVLMYKQAIANVISIAIITQWMLIFLSLICFSLPLAICFINRNYLSKSLLNEKQVLCCMLCFD